MRGGGGNYAIVVGMELGLVEHAELYAGNLMFPLERAREVLGAWRDWTEGAPEQATSIAALIRVPPLPFVPEPMRGAKLAVVDVAWAGDLEEGKRAVDPLRELGPVMDTFQPMPPAGLAAVHNDPEDPLPFMGRSTLLSGLPDDALEAMMAIAGPDVDTPLLTPRGAAARRGARPATRGRRRGRPPGGAVHGVRAGRADGPARRGRGRRGRARRRRAGARPWSSGRRFLNFVMATDDVGSVFAPEVLARLREVKGRYDPDGRILSSHPLPRVAERHPARRRGPRGARDETARNPRREGRDGPRDLRRIACARAAPGCTSRAHQVTREALRCRASTGRSTEAGGGGTWTTGSRRPASTRSWRWPAPS